MELVAVQVAQELLQIFRRVGLWINQLILAVILRSSYEYKQCTWFTWNRAKDFGMTFGMYMGNGADWQKQAGYSVTTTPVTS